MTSEGLGEAFEGDSADTCVGKFLLVSMGGRANGQACADGERGHWTTFKIPPFSAQKSHRAGGRGGPRIFCCCWNPNIFVTQEPMQNFKTLRQSLLGELAMSPEEREKERKRKNCQL
jgi:hypothetical protein